MFSGVILVLLSVVFAAYLYVKWCHTFWSNRRIPFIQPKIPFGNVSLTRPKEHFSLFIARLYNETKNNGSPITGLYFLHRPVAIATDLKFVQKVMIKDFHHFEDRGLYYNQKDDPLSAHLLNLEPNQWKPLRSKLTPTFTSGRMKFMFPTIVNVGQEFAECLSKELEIDNEIEIRDLLGRFTTDVIGTCAFGIECNSLKDPNTKFRQMCKKIFDQPKLTRLSRSLMSANKDLARFLGLRANHADVSEFFLTVVKETIEYREKNNVERKDFMDLLIQLKNDGHLKGEANTGVGRLTFLEIAAQAYVFFLAGFETSSTTLTYALYELAQPYNKLIQKKARKEINEVLAKYDGQLTYEALNQMTYIEQVVNESLRKYPPAAILSRDVTKDYKCEQTKMVFHKGMSIMIPVYGIHHDPDIYDQPEEFRPERFAAEEVKKRPSCSFLAFGDGPRNCIGMRFGMIQTKIGLVMLLKHFKFSTTDRTPSFPMQFSPFKVILSPVEGVWLNIKRV